MKLKLTALAFLFAISACHAADFIYLSELYDFSVNGPAVLRYDTAGNGSVFGYSGLQAPNGLAFDSQGTLYVASFGNNLIQTFDPSGHASVFANSGLNQPAVLTFDHSGNLYVANNGNGQGYIEKFDSAGHASLFASGLAYPAGITSDNNGNVYVSTWVNNMTGLAILKYTPAGQRSTFVTWDTPATHFGIPRGLTFYNNNIYCTDGNSLDKITLAGQVSVLATAGLSNSIGVAVDSLGNFYVTDQNNGYVMKFDSSGHGSVFASGFNNGNLLTYVAVQTVPEPALSALIALGLGLLSLAAYRRRLCPQAHR